MCACLHVRASSLADAVMFMQGEIYIYIKYIYIYISPLGSCEVLLVGLRNIIVLRCLACEVLLLACISGTVTAGAVLDIVNRCVSMRGSSASLHIIVLRCLARSCLPVYISGIVTAGAILDTRGHIKFNFIICPLAIA